MEICSLSGGKDSVALCIKGKYNQSVFYDTEMEFKAIYNVIEQLKLKGVNIITLKADKPFDYYVFEHCRIKGKNKGKKGYGWCGGVCRWGTTEKLKKLDNFAKINKLKIAIGIAFDETHRTEKERANYKTMPLVDWGMTERDCLNFCREQNFCWLEKTNSKFNVPNYIDLYDILDRVSCWCCRNKNLKELKNYFKYFTYSYWQLLKDREQKIGVKMKGKKWLYEYEPKWEQEILYELKGEIKNGRKKTND